MRDTKWMVLCRTYLTTPPRKLTQFTAVLSVFENYWSMPAIYMVAALEVQPTHRALMCAHAAPCAYSLF